MGRPSVGPKVEVRLPPDTLAAVDRLAEREGLRRAAMLRALIERSLS